MTKNSSQKFKIWNEFVYRRTRLEKSDIFNRLGKRKAVSVFQDSDVQQIMYENYPGLTDRLNRKITCNTLNDKDLLTIEKFLRRLCSRATPFGTIAGIGVANVQEEESNQQSQAYKIVRVPVGRQYEFDPNTSENSVLNLNPTIRFLVDGLTIYSFDQQWQRKKIQLPDQIISFLKKKIWPLSRERLQKSLSRFCGVDAHQAAGIITRLQSLEVCSLSNNLDEQTKKKAEFDKVLVFEGNDILMTTQAMQEIARVVESVKPLHQAVTHHDPSLWSDVRSFLNDYFEHGPVPLMSLSESVIRSYADRRQGLQPAPHACTTYMEKRLREVIASEQNIWTISDQEWANLVSLSEADKSELPSSTLTGIWLSTDTKMSHFSLRGFQAGSASQILGRFKNFDKKIAGLVEKIHRKEQDISTIISANVEVSCRNSRFSRLQSPSSFFDHIIHCETNRFYGTQRPLPLNTLVFCRDEKDQWRLYEQERGRLVMPMRCDALSTQAVSFFPYSLLMSYSANFVNFCQDSFVHRRTRERFDILPRISRKGLVLSPARWSVKFLDKNRIGMLPENITLVEGDMRLPLLKSHPLVQQFARQSAQAEALGETAQRWLEETLDEPDSEPREIIFISEKIVDEKSTSQDNERFRRIRNEKKSLSFNPSFFSYRLFFDPLFSTLIIEAFASLKSGYFFIFYPAIETHIRLRVSSRKWSACQDLLKKLLEDELILKYESSNYQPEQFRWGGLSGLKFYEELSCVDSQRICSKFFISELKRPNCNEISLALSIGQTWLEIFYPKPEHRAEFLIRNIPKPKHGWRLSDEFSRKVSGASVSSAVVAKMRLPITLRRKIGLYTKKLDQKARDRWQLSLMHLSWCRLGFGLGHTEERMLVQKLIKHSLAGKRAPENAPV